MSARIAPPISRRALLAGGAAGLAGLLLTGCSGREAPELTMACGEPGGTYIRFGKALGRAARAAGLTSGFTARVTGGSAENLELLAEGRVDLGISLADSAVENSDGLVAIGRVYQNYLQCAVRVDRGFSSVAELAGRRVSIGAIGSGTALSAQRTLTAVGLLDADREDPVEPLDLRLADAVTRLGEGSIDALFWSGGLPVPEFERLEDAHPVTLLDLTSALPSLNEQYGAVYQRAAVPSAVYRSDEPLSTIGVSNLLLARPDLPDDLAAGLVDALVDDAEQLIPQPSYGAHFLSTPTLIGTAPIPLHPAAQARYAQKYG